MRKTKTSTGWAIKHNGELKRIVVTDDPRRNSAGRPTAAAVMLELKQAHYRNTEEIWKERYRGREHESLALGSGRHRYASQLDAYEDDNNWTLSVVEVVSYRE